MASSSAASRRSKDGYDIRFSFNKGGAGGGPVELGCRSNFGEPWRGSTGRDSGGGISREDFYPGLEHSLPLLQRADQATTSGFPPPEGVPDPSSFIPGLEAAVAATMARLGTSSHGQAGAAQAYAAAVAAADGDDAAALAAIGAPASVAAADLVCPSSGPGLWQIQAQQHLAQQLLAQQQQRLAGVPPLYPASECGDMQPFTPHTTVDLGGSLPAFSGGGWAPWGPSFAKTSSAGEESQAQEMVLARKGKEALDQQARDLLTQQARGMIEKQARDLLTQQARGLLTQQARGVMLQQARDLLTQQAKGTNMMQHAMDLVTQQNRDILTQQDVSQKDILCHQGEAFTGSLLNVEGAAKMLSQQQVAFSDWSHSVFDVDKLQASAEARGLASSAGLARRGGTATGSPPLPSAGGVPSSMPANKSQQTQATSGSITLGGSVTALGLPVPPSLAIRRANLIETSEAASLKLEQGLKAMLEMRSGRGASSLEPPLDDPVEPTAQAGPGSVGSLLHLQHRASKGREGEEEARRKMLLASLMLKKPPALQALTKKEGIQSHFSSLDGLFSFGSASPSQGPFEAVMPLNGQGAGPSESLVDSSVMHLVESKARQGSHLEVGMLEQGNARKSRSLTGVVVVGPNRLAAETSVSQRSGTQTEQEKRMRKLALNKEAARRMRRRQATRLEELEKTVLELQASNSSSKARLKEANRRMSELEKKNGVLEDRVVELACGIVRKGDIPFTLQEKVADLVSSLSADCRSKLPSCLQVFGSGSLCAPLACGDRRPSEPKVEPEDDMAGSKKRKVAIWEGESKSVCASVPESVPACLVEAQPSGGVLGEPTVCDFQMYRDHNGSFLDNFLAVEDVHGPFDFSVDDMPRR